jgi:uncharacterized protein (TIGR02145 family)
MKKIVFFMLLLLCMGVLRAQNDTMYIMKNGAPVARISYKEADMDSIIFYNPVYPKGSFVDERDGTVYRTVIIGQQIWLAENLRYLPSVNTTAETSYSEPRYYVYRHHTNDLEAARKSEYYQVHGTLYNWPASMAGAVSSNSNPSGVQGACPAGWHLPSAAEFKQLAEFLGESVAGGKIKATGTTWWHEPNLMATNETGFSALGSGELLKDGDAYHFVAIKQVAIWWCSKEYDSSSAINWGTMYNISKLYDNTPHIPGVIKSMAFPVRCVKD